MYNRTLVLGDIHGNFKALEDVLVKASYNPKTDRLICVGDYVDGYPESYKVVEKLIQLKEVNNSNIYLLGNHDDWTKEILRKDLKAFQDGQIDQISRKYPFMWNQGGKATFYSYINQLDPKPNWEAHIEFFNSLVLYHIEDNILFVHGGWDIAIYPDFLSAASIDPEQVYWDRSLFKRATHLQHLLNKGYDVLPNKTYFGKFDKIFIGHTSTKPEFQEEFPTLQVCNVINTDTGAGHRGKLTAYCLEDNSIYQSDFAFNYYPDHIQDEKRKKINKRNDL